MASNNQGNPSGKSNRGFASMDPQRQPPQCDERFQLELRLEQQRQQRPRRQQQLIPQGRLRAALFHLSAACTVAPGDARSEATPVPG